MYTREETVNGKKIKLSLRDEVDESVVNEIFKFKEYRGITQIIKDAKGIVLDVGAHAGYFSLWTAALNSKIKILSLEPVKENFDFLERNLKENIFKNIKPEKMALCKETGKIKIFLSEDSQNHSLLPISKQTQEVNAINFGDLVKKYKISLISLLKMDIEGGEYEIFENSIVDIAVKTENIFLEYHQVNDKNFKMLENILRENGFSVENFPSHFDKTMGFLLARNKRLKKQK
ncbi:MAG TPA: FkbM family methyltransferase [Candidatus Magasanikbacteria bacterium]|nr:FkbM family methyltransferase [Candidatus Magasanikbacteria bacterium]